MGRGIAAWIPLTCIKVATPGSVQLGAQIAHSIAPALGVPLEIRHLCCACISCHVGWVEGSRIGWLPRRAGK